MSKVCQALFNTHCFLLAFLPLTLLAYYAVPSVRWKHAVLAVAGAVFYSFWDVRFVGLLVAAALVDFLLARAMEKTSRKKAVLIASIVFNLGVLAFFKYVVFVAENARSLLALIDDPVELPYFSIVLPVGISFFTFKSMSYTIDVYRGEVPATKDLTKYLAFISLFPDLVAGPIVRFRDLSAQLDKIPRRLSASGLAIGLTFLAVGLFKKVVIADTIARWSDPLWGAATISAPQAWLAVAGFTAQLYFDFSGYSDMAIGLAALLGLVFPLNFDAPYQARNPSDFWRRWHMTLSSWFRDYVYIPIGGNRNGRTRWGFNLLLVMILAGLWHGAEWTFIAWGAYHGLLLLGYRAWADRWDRLPRLFQRGLTLFLVMIGWVIFRAPDLATAGRIYVAAFFGGLHPTWSVLPALLMTLAVVAFAAVAPTLRDLRPWATPARAAVVGLMSILTFVMLTSGESPFLYYRF